MSNWTTTSGNRSTEGKVCNWVNVVAFSCNLCASCVAVIHNFFIHQSFALKASSGINTLIYYLTPDDGAFWNSFIVPAGAYKAMCWNMLANS